jgi:hypothetical protein
MIGPDHHAEHYTLKRKALVQWTGGKIVRSGPVTCQLHKTGQTFLLFINGKKELAFFDFNFLHKHPTYLSLVLRVGSCCLIRSLRLFES